MSVTINYNKYLILINKKNQSSLLITAHTEQGTSIFESPQIQLKKIKYETVLAALNKQNEKNLLTKINYQAPKENKPGKLTLSIIVRYDFIPEFSEDIILIQRQLNQNDSLKVKLSTLEKDLSDVLTSINAMKTDGVIKYSESKTVSCSKETEFGELSLTKGKYLVQISGMHKGTHSGEKVSLQLVINEKQNIQLPEPTPYFLSAPYSFPYSISQVIELQKLNNNVKLVVKSGTAANIQNQLFIAKPIYV